MTAPPMVRPMGPLPITPQTLTPQNQTMTPGMIQSLLQGKLGSYNQPDPIDPVAIAKLKDAQLKKFSDSDQGKEVVAWVRTQYDKMKSARLTIQREWYINLAMYYGEQYYEILGSTYNSDGTRALSLGGSLGVPKAPKHRVRTTVNLIRPMIRTEISRLTSQKPSATVVPATGEDDDMAAALAGEAIWEYLQSTSQFSNTIMMRHVFWKVITGTSYIKSWWDPNKVDRGSRTKEGQQVTGAICYGVVTPFNLFVPDYLISEIEDQPYVFEVYTKSAEWVKQNFKNVFGNDDPAPDVVSQSEVFETKYFQIANQALDAAPNSCLFIEAWIKPGYNKYLPNGGVITIAAGKVVQFEEGLPYEHGEYPYAKSTHIETGTFYGHSVIKDIKHLQKEYNRTRSHIIESKNRMGRPQLLVANGSVDVTKLTSEPGLIIPYNPGFQPPTALPIQPLPAYVLEEQDRIKSDMEDISGQHQVSKGMAPGGGVEAATAISFLQEKDDSLLYGTFASQDAMVEKIARQSLTLVAQYWDIPRIIRVVGSDGAFDSFEFKGSQIANGLDIKIEAGSSLPMSKPARQAFLMDLFKSGAITAVQMLDMMDIGGVQKLTERIRVDMKAAQRENLKMKMMTPELLMMYEQEMQQQVQNGGPDQQNPMTGEWMFNQDKTTWPPLVPVNEWDNHQVHIDTHNNYRKGQEFDTLDQGIKDQFQAHIAVHQQALQMQNPMAMMGMPGGAGGSSPPGGQAQPQGQQSPGGQQDQMPPELQQMMQQGGGPPQ